jgi:hypothetical protein
LSDLLELEIGVALLVISIGIFIVCYPRKGKTAWFVGTPFIGPAMSILIVGGLAMGLILVTASFTTIDDITMSGKR